MLKRIQAKSRKHARELKLESKGDEIEEILRETENRNEEMIQAGEHLDNIYSEEPAIATRSGITSKRNHLKDYVRCSKFYNENPVCIDVRAEPTNLSFRYRNCISQWRN